MATTSTLRATFGALLGTVQTTANAVTGTVNTVAATVGMVDKYVADASAKQVLDSKADMATYRASVIARKSEEIAEMQVKAVAYCAQSPDHLRFYEEANAAMTKLLEG